MKVSKVVEQVMCGELSVGDGASILGISVRQFHRWRERLLRDPEGGLVDGRKGKVPGNKVSKEEVEHVLNLYREFYCTFSAPHFRAVLAEEHGIKRSTTWLKTVLHDTGLRRRGTLQKRVHRKKRERKPLTGMMLHLDGSKHRWFASEDGGQQDLLLVLDDATSEILAGLFVPEENTQSCMSILKTVLQKHGTFVSLYTDRASHFVYTPVAGGPVDKSVRTQIGRALDELGIEHIPAFSPQARGRGERVNRTLQDRLTKELAAASITTYEGAQKYFDSKYRPRHNRELARPASTTAATAFLAANKEVIEKVCQLRYTRKVKSDNTIHFQGQVLQLPKTGGYSTLAQRTVEVRVDVDGVATVCAGTRVVLRTQLTVDWADQSLDRAA